LIDPRGAEVFPGARNVWYGPSAWPQGVLPAGTSVLGRLADALITDKYRYTEHRLEPRQHLSALGAFRSVGGISVESPEPAIAALLRDWKQDQSGLLGRFDANHDGVLSSEEWTHARNAARQQIQNGRNAAARAPRISVLAEPDDGRAFLLAASDALELARKLRGRASAAFAVSVGSAAAAAWLWMQV
jgi:hypothetical protein